MTVPICGNEHTSLKKTALVNVQEMPTDIMKRARSIETRPATTQKQRKTTPSLVRQSPRVLTGSGSSQEGSHSRLPLAPKNTSIMQRLGRKITLPSKEKAQTIEQTRTSPVFARDASVQVGLGDRNTDQDSTSSSDSDHAADSECNSIQQDPALRDEGCVGRYEYEEDDEEGEEDDDYVTVLVFCETCHQNLCDRYEDQCYHCGGALCERCSLGLDPPITVLARSYHMPERGYTCSCENTGFSEPFVTEFDPPEHYARIQSRRTLRIYTSQPSYTVTFGK